MLLRLGPLVLAPLLAVFVEALHEGWLAAVATLAERDALAAIGLTVAFAAVPLSALFGIAAAWWVTKFRRRGRAVVLTLIDLPFAVPARSGARRRPGRS